MFLENKLVFVKKVERQLNYICRAIHILGAVKDNLQIYTAAENKMHPSISPQLSQLRFLRPRYKLFKIYFPELQRKHQTSKI